MILGREEEIAPLIVLVVKHHGDAVAAHMEGNNIYPLQLFKLSLNMTERVDQPGGLWGLPSNGWPFYYIPQH